jgi:hypothetical protein
MGSASCVPKKSQVTAIQKNDKANEVRIISSEKNSIPKKPVSNRHTNITDIPIDSLIHVSEFLAHDPLDVIKFSHTCQTFNNAVNEAETSPKLWQYLYFAQYGVSFWELATGRLGEFQQKYIKDYNVDLYSLSSVPEHQQASLDEEGEEEQQEEEEYDEEDDEEEYQRDPTPAKDHLIELPLDSKARKYNNTTNFRGLEFDNIVAQERSDIKRIQKRVRRICEDSIMLTRGCGLEDYCVQCMEGTDWRRKFWDDTRNFYNWNQGGCDVRNNDFLDEQDQTNSERRANSNVIRVLVCGEDTGGKRAFITGLASTGKSKYSSDRLTILEYSMSNRTYTIQLLNCNSPVDWYQCYRGQPVDALLYYLDNINDQLDEIEEVEYSGRSKACTQFHGNI